jgi:hypothetical protein
VNGKRKESQRLEVRGWRQKAKIQMSKLKVQITLIDTAHDPRPRSAVLIITSTNHGHELGSGGELGQQTAKH